MTDLVTQTLMVGDGSGKRGNCLQAAVASYFECELQAVPDFANFGPLDDGGYNLWWWALFLGYFAERGYVIRHIGLDEGRRPLPDERCLVHGDSPRGGGINHVVVAEHGEVIWDPHPSRDGLAVIKGAWIPESVSEMRAIVRAWNERGAG